MRPTAADSAFPSTPRSRKSSAAGAAPPLVTPSHGVPTTFFLRSEEEMEASLSQSASRHARRDSTYGVQSLEDALDDAFGSSKGSEDEGSVGERGGGSISGKKKRQRVGEIPEHLVKSKVAAFEKYIHEKESPPPAVAANRSPSQQVHLRRASLTTLSQPLTPLCAESPVPGGSLGTPRSVSLKSFRLSDEEGSEAADSGSQAVASSEEGEGSEVGVRTEGEGSAPQLVMPSIKMPSRRPFTEKGKRLGRLKMLVAGRAGVGKTSLIRSIVHVCEDIVHVDPLSPTSSIVQSQQSRKSKSREQTTDPDGTTEITEIHASTRAYPPWWSEMEESRVLRRRRSMGDTVLERNLCFIDTPGLDCSEALTESMDSVIQYIEALLHRNASIATMSDSDLLGMLSGNGGVQVDVVLYVFSHDADISADLEYVRRLSVLTNIIPVISKADMLSSETVASLKASILQHLDSSSIRPFLFGKSVEAALQTVSTVPDTSEPTSFDPTARLTVASLESSTQFSTLPPYATSTLPSADSDTMDASLLMSPDYVQPLVPSELSALVAYVLNPDTIAWLRHSAVKKFLQWRKDVAERSGEPIPPYRIPPLPSQPGRLGLRYPASPTSSILSSPSPSQVLVPHSSSSYPRSLSPSSDPYPSSVSHPNTAAPSATAASAYTLARLVDHTQREERLAQVRLAKWAADLQRSLANERDRYRELARGDRAKWLVERMGDEVEEGRLVSVAVGAAEKGEGGGRAEWALVKRGARMPERARWALRPGELDVRDPLGLAGWEDGVRRGGWVLVRVLGGCGVVGAVVLAVVRVWGVESVSALPRFGFGFVEGWWGWWGGD